MSGPDLPTQPGIQPGAAKTGPHEVKEAPEYEAPIYKVRWSCSLKGQEAAWLASGGQTGIVRCQRVKLSS